MGASVFIGVLGGTFDPIHRAHLELAEAAVEQLGLDRIIFIPAGQPWLKDGQPLTPARHRLAMVRLAVEGNPAFSVSDMEINRPGPSYTVDTLEALRQDLGEREELYLIVGEDVLNDFHRWKNPDRILQLCRLAVFERADVKHSARKAVQERFGNVDLIKAGLPDISGTQIRRSAARGEPLNGKVTKPVEDYINRYGLYRMNVAG